MNRVVSAGGVEIPGAELRGPLCHPVPVPSAVFRAIMRPATQLLLSGALRCVQAAVAAGVQLGEVRRLLPNAYKTL